MSKPWVANYSEEMAKEILGSGDTVAISVTSIERNVPLKGYVQILRVAFDDIDPDGKAGMILSGKPINEYQAQWLASFIQEHRGKNFMVHCAAGISRSGAIVETILELYPEYEDRGGVRYPNNHVRRLLKRALGMVPIGAEK